MTEVTNPYSRPGYRYYVLAVLTLVYAINLLDRNLLIILQEPIKEEFQLSDTQLGLMTGFAFALFYTVCGIPIARWADKGNRRSIIAIAITVWSVMTALGGLALTYSHLLLARIGVGVGEAGGSPPAHSMISDIFSSKYRATALSVYSTGVYIGVLSGFLLGGWLADTLGWRMAFLCIGAPGVLIALLVRLTISEPIRRKPEAAKEEASFPSLKETVDKLWGQPAFRHLALAAGLQGFVASGVGSWLPPYFLRNFDISLSELGVYLAFTAGIGGAVGSIASGWFADLMARKSHIWYLLIPAIATLINIPFAILQLTTDNLSLAMSMVAITTFFGAMHLAPIVAVTHEIVGPSARALSSAILFFVLNLIGAGFGPTFVGILSDHFLTAGALNPLRISMLVTFAIMSIWCCVHYLLGARALHRVSKAGA